MSDAEQPPGRSRTTLARQLLTGLFVTAVGISGAALLLPDFRLDGSVAQRLLAVLAISAVFVVGIGVVPSPVYRALRRAQARNLRDMAEEPDLYASDREFFAPVRRMWLLGGVSTAISVVLAPAVLWLSVWLCDALGLSVRLSGFWPTVIVAVVVAAAARMVGWIPALFLGRRRARTAIRALAAYACILAGLWLAVAVLGDVRLESGPGELQVLAMVVFTALFALVDLQVTAPGLTMVAALAINGLKLWLLSWLSTWMDITLRISGFWTFVLAALMLTIAIWLARLGRSAQPQPQAPDPILDPFHGHPHDMGPLY